MKFCFTNVLLLLAIIVFLFCTFLLLFGISWLLSGTLSWGEALIPVAVIGCHQADQPATGTISTRAYQPLWWLVET